MKFPSQNNPNTAHVYTRYLSFLFLLALLQGDLWVIFDLTIPITPIKLYLEP